jgi:two-component system, chemotaxis family, sensor kinase CheA
MIKGISKNAFGKYSTIIISVALFLVFDLGVLVLNFFTAAKIAEDAQAVNLAGRQRMLSQRISKASFIVEERLREGASAATELAELNTSIKLFDTTLIAFKNGGATQGGAGQPVVLEAVTTLKGTSAIASAQALFEPAAQNASRLIAAQRPTLEEATAVANGFESINLKLLGHMNDLTSEIETTAAAAADRLRMVQLIGIGLALINFCIILFHFIRQLRTADRAVEVAKKETDDILRTTQEGMFLLDRKFVMGNQHSQSLEDLMGTSNVAGANFLDLLKPMVTAKTLDTTKEYLDLLLSPDVNEKLVRSLNPLDNVEINFVNAAGTPENRNLQFKFNRVYEKTETGEEIAQLLVTAADITKSVRLAQELQESEARAESQMGLMVQILKVDPTQLKQYIAAAQEGLTQINNELKVRAATGLRAKIESIFRITHRLKGDAGAIGLGRFGDSFHELEDQLSKLKQQDKLAGEDFLPVTVHVKKIYGELDAMQGVVGQLSNARSSNSIEPVTSVSATSAASAPSFVQRWQQFANEIAQRQGKRAEVSYRGVDFTQLPSKAAEGLNSIINQLIRNAIAHGIESPKDRANKGKADTGRMAIYLTEDADGLELSFRDDGKGISADDVKAAAVRSGRLTEQQAQQLDARAAIGLIFEPGFSTRDAASSDGDAGKGAGLDVVKSLITELGGKLRMGSTPGEYCQFRVRFPQIKTASASTTSDADSLDLVLN